MQQIYQCEPRTIINHGEEISLTFHGDCIKRALYVITQQIKRLLRQNYVRGMTNVSAWLNDTQSSKSHHQKMIQTISPYSKDEFLHKMDGLNKNATTSHQKEKQNQKNKQNELAHQEWSNNRDFQFYYPSQSRLPKKCLE